MMKTFKQLTTVDSINEAIKYHINNNIPVSQSLYRPYSENFFNVFNKARELFEEGNYTPVNDVELEMLNSEIGRFDIYENEEVPLDIPLMEMEDKKELNKPKRGGSKKFYVYTKNANGNVVKVSFGAKEGGGNLAVKINDPDARNAFAARHNCSQANDKTTPKYWACRLPRYAKALGLKVNNPSAWW